MNDSAARPETRQIKEQLERILGSKTFHLAQRSRAFLRYVVEKSLEAASPKEYAIAVDVLGRDEDYDSAIDATVRVEAGRLRGRLREYYHTEGKHDSILIDIPKGRYAATFDFRQTHPGAVKALRFPVEPVANVKAEDPEVEATSQGRYAATFDFRQTHPGAVKALRFPVEPVANVKAEDPEVEATSRRGHTAQVATAPRRRKLWLAGAGLAAVLAGLGAWFITKRPNAAAPIHSLAVLPLQNLSGDPGQDYFADGITDELITELAQIPGLRVVSRTSVMQDKGNKKSLRQIARELDVDAIVEGSTVRSGDRVRITAQLIDARTDRHLWARSFEGSASDVLALQDSVASQIAAQARLVLLPPQPRPAINPAAHDAYLRGRYFFNKQDFAHSVAYFQQAISIDPTYASGWAGYSTAYEAFAVNELKGPDEVMPKALAAALAQLQRAAEMEDSPGSIDNYMSLIYEQKGERDLAVRYDVNALQASYPQLDAEALLAVYRQQGWQPYWRARIQTPLNAAPASCIPYEIGVDDLRVGNPDLAFASFQRALDQHCFYMALVRVDPLLDPVRHDPRYADLLTRIHQR